MTTLGDRIRTLLKAQGNRSQRDLARHIEMPPDALSRALNGERGFAITELVAIASELETSIHWLATGEADPFEIRVAARHGYDRATQTRQAVDWEASRETLESLALAYEQVQRDLPPRIGPRPGSADHTRQLLEAGDSRFVRRFADAIESTFAIDVVRIPGLGGGFTMEVARRTVVAVPETSNWFFQNWSLAHELGHVSSGSLHRLNAPSTDVDASEADANAFAAELLLPAAQLRATDWRSATVADAAEFIWKAGVSTEALANRLNKHQPDAVFLIRQLESTRTQRFLRANLRSTSDARGRDIITERMQEASARRFPMELLTAHRDAVQDRGLNARTLAWMLNDSLEAVEAELRPATDESTDDLDDFFGPED